MLVGSFIFSVFMRFLPEVRERYSAIKFEENLKTSETLTEEVESEVIQRVVPRQEGCLDADAFCSFELL